MMKRKGTFKLDYNLICQDFYIAQTVLSTVVVVRAELCYETNKITYWAFSNRFDEVDDRIVPPEYEAILTDRDKVEWRKVE